METLNVQVRRIDGDLVELLFDPHEADLRVGETITLREPDADRSVIVQVIAFRSVTFPSLALDQLHTLAGPEPIHAPLLEVLGYHLSLPQDLDEQAVKMGNLKVALAKIRKTVPAAGDGQPVRWEQWDGWIPARDVEILRTQDHEVFANSTRDLGHRPRMGRTLAGHDFFIEGQDLEKVNVITGVKGAGKSHLAKVILLESIAHGAPCIVFDINKENIHLPKAQVDARTGQTLQRGIVHLEAGGNLRLSVRQFGLVPLMTLMVRFGLPEVSALNFENRLARLWAEAEAMEREHKQPPYIGLEQLMQMADEKNSAAARARRSPRRMRRSTRASRRRR